MKPTVSTRQPTLAEQVAQVRGLDVPDEDVLLSLGIGPGKKPRATRRTMLTILRADRRWTGRSASTASATPSSLTATASTTAT